MTNKKQGSNEWMQYVGLATQWLVMLGLALWAGMAIDKKIGPNARIATITLPLIALTYSLWKIIKQFNRPK